MLARIRTALRHRLSADVAMPLVRIEDVEIDIAHRQIRKGGEEVHLTPKEFGFLIELAKHPGRVVTHSHLLRTPAMKTTWSICAWRRVACGASWMPIPLGR